MLLLLFVILSLAFGYYLWCQRKFYILSWKIRGALGLPFLGIAWKIKNPDGFMTTMCELRVEYKSPLTLWMGTKCVLYVDDPATLQDVLNAKDCTDKTQLFDGVKDVLGHTILTARYDDWQRYRRLFASCFSHNTLLTFFEIFNNNAKGLTKRFEEVAGKDPIDIRDAIKISFFDNALQTICSRDMAFTEKEHSDLLMAVSSQTELFVLRMTHPWLLVQWIYRLTDSYKLQVKCNQIVKLVVNKIMDYKLKQRLEEEEDFQENKSGICLDKALDLEKNGYLTKQEIYDHIATFMATAFETLSAHIFLTILCLAMYPEYQEKLIEELAANLPADPDAEISYENIKDLKYLDMVYNETLRLMPAIPLTFREVTNDFKLQNGVTLPKGTQILISMFNAHRSKEIWGEKAHEFYPDHFLPENLAKVHPYAFIPFLKGIRVCIETICSRDMAFTEKEHSDLLMAVSSQTELFVLRITHPWLLVQWIYRLTNSYKLQVKCNQIFKHVVNKIMDYKLKQRLEEEEDFQENKSGICLDKALDLEKNGYLTKQEIYDHIATFMATAFETLSAHIFLTILCLAMYPEYQEKLIEELAANLPADPDAEISYENIKDLKYLDMVYNETLRLMPAIPLTFREVTNDFKLQNGVTLPKGTQILISMFNAHRSKEIWGEKAHEFYPDHFLPENLAKVHPYAFIPFLKGIRICIGYKYAGFISKVFLCRIFRKFRVRTKTKLEDLKYVDNISLQVKNKCLIEVYKI